MSSAQIQAKDGILHVSMPKLKTVAIDRYPCAGQTEMNLDKAYYRDETFETRLYQNLPARTLREHNNYRCKILNSTTRQFFETLARKYGICWILKSTIRNVINKSGALLKANTHAVAVQFAFYLEPGY